MAFLIFLVVLGVLVFVHELGHFLAAKKAGVRVDEFGLGYPPRALKIGEKWGTLFTLNWIPFGGFVKIFGENYDNEEGHYEERISVGKNFTQVSKKWQAIILAAGVIFNIIFAWLLFSFGFMIGLPTSADNEFGMTVKDPALTIIEVLPDSPAQNANLKPGDKIKSISLDNGSKLKELNPENVSNFVNESTGQVLVEIDRGGEKFDFKITPEEGIAKDRKIIGINMDMIGILSLPIHRAIYEGGRTTFEITYLTIGGIFNLVKDAIGGHADISQVAGPVGIIGLVGDASRLGLIYLITFTALISINLAIINLVPFPALDGGRILFVAIEGITKRKMNSKVAQVLNTVGFAILIALMLLVTYRDILRLI